MPLPTGKPIGGVTWMGGFPTPGWQPPQLSPLAVNDGYQPGMPPRLPMMPQVQMGYNGPGRYAMPTPGGGGGGGMPAYHGLMQGKHIQGGIARNSYTQHDDAQPIPPGYAPAPGTAPPPAKPQPQMPGAPPRPGGDAMSRFYQANPSLPTPQNFVPNSADNAEALNDLPDGPTPAWHGGRFMPGQSAIVGDKPNGDPGPNAEVVTAIPGGGFTVTPNPKNMPHLPRLAGGTGGQAFGEAPDPAYNDLTMPLPSLNKRGADWQIEPGEYKTPDNIRQSPPANSAAETYIKQQQAIANKPGFWSGIDNTLTGGIQSAAGAVGRAWDWTQGPGEGIGATFHDWMHGDNPERTNALASIEHAKKYGAPSTVPRTMPDPFGLPLPPGATSGHAEPEWDALNEDVQGLPGGGPSGHDEPDWNIKQPEAAWLPHQLNTYALAQATNEKWHQTEGQKGWIDPTMAAMQAGLNPPAQQPSEVAFPDPSIAKANATLQQWRGPASPSAAGMPEGLSPASQAAYTDRRQRLVATKRGQQQLLQEDLTQTGQTPQQQGQQTMNRQDYDYRHGPHTYQTPEGEMTFINGLKVEGAKTRDLTPEELHRMGLTANSYKDSNGLQYGPVAHTSTGALARPLLDKAGRATGHYVTVDNKGNTIGSAFKGVGEGELQPGWHQVSDDTRQLVGADHKVVEHQRLDESGKWQNYDPKSKPKEFKPGSPHNFGGGIDPKTGEKVNDWRQQGPDNKWYPVEMSDAMTSAPAGVIIKRKN